MKKMLIFHDVLPVFLIGASVWLSSGSVLLAQEVPHHDFLVDMGDPQQCLTCHNGMIAPNVTPCQIHCLIDREISHPVFVSYPPAGREREFVPAGLVEARGIRLIDGEVTCVSCHNLMNQGRYHLVMEDYRSRLCTACHRR